MGKKKKQGHLDEPFVPNGDPEHNYEGPTLKPAERPEECKIPFTREQLFKIREILSAAPGYSPPPKSKFDPLIEVLTLAVEFHYWEIEDEPLYQSKSIHKIRKKFLEPTLTEIRDQAKKLHNSLFELHPDIRTSLESVNLTDRMVLYQEGTDPLDKQKRKNNLQRIRQARKALRNQDFLKLRNILADLEYDIGLSKSLPWPVDTARTITNSRQFYLAADRLLKETPHVNVAWAKSIAGLALIWKKAKGKLPKIKPLDDLEEELVTFTCEWSDERMIITPDACINANGVNVRGKFEYTCPTCPYKDGPPKVSSKHSKVNKPELPPFLILVNTFFEPLYPQWDKMGLPARCSAIRRSLGLLP